MCSVEGDIEEISNCTERLKKITFEALKKCKKCDNKPILLLQRKDPFCKDCFFEYCDHKFRSTIGKTKIVKHGQKVLLAISGGQKSSALLKMTSQALKSTSVKQISFVTGILYLDETIGSNSPTEENRIGDIIQELKTFGYPILISSLEMVQNLNGNEDLYRIVDPSDEDMPSLLHSKPWLEEYTKDMSLSSKLDFIRHIRLRLMTDIANRAGYDYLFLGDTATSLAIDLLTNISLGRGSQISSDTSFLDSRYKVPICRPIREFLNKEVALYAHLQNCPYFVLPNLITKTDERSSVQRLTETFITNLEKDFPATVFTIFRTGGKLSKQNYFLTEETCLLCKSTLDNIQPDSCSALEAMRVSEKISQALLGCGDEANPIETAKSRDETLNTSYNYFDILKFFCYGCSAQLDIDGKILMKNILPFISYENVVKMERHEMNDQIKDYLINNSVK